MNLKKTLFTSMAAITLLSAGATVVNGENNTQVVEAKTVTKTLKRSAAIYTVKGKRANKKTLKKGKRVRVYGYKTIKGKRYARIGSGQYIKASNLASVKAKKHVAKKHYKSESKALGRKYQSWLNNRKKGNLVAIRNTKVKLTTMSDIIDNVPHNIKKGQTIPMWYGKGMELKKIKGQYYFKYNNIGWQIKLPSWIKCSDITFKKIPNEEQFEAIRKRLDKNCDSDGNIMITLKHNLRGTKLNGKKGQTLKAGKNYILADTWVQVGANNKLYITASNYNSDLAARVNENGDSVFMIPYSAVKNITKPNMYINDDNVLVKGSEK